MKKDKRFTVRGRVVMKEDQKGVLGLRVEVFDKDHLFDDQLGRAISNENGDFILQYREKDFRDLFEKAPDLYVKIFDCKGDLVYSSEDAVVWDVGQVAEINVAVPKAKLIHHLENTRLLPRLSGGIVAQEKLDTINRAIGLLEARGLISPTMPLGSRPFGPGGPELIPLSAAYCPAPDIFIFGEILDTAWGVIDNDPAAVLDLASILDTISHRQEVKKPEQFRLAAQQWRTDNPSDIEALGQLLETKRELLVEGPSETLIEKERYLPVIMATILAARGDTHVKNRYLGVLLGQLGALGQMDVIYRSARNALGSNPGGIGGFGSLSGFVGGTCGPADGPMPYPINPEEHYEVDDLWRVEKWFATAEMDRALSGLHASSYEIHDVDWGDGCPGSPVVITGENFLGLFPEQHRVRFTNRSGLGWAEAAPANFVTDWTDTRIEVPVPAEAGPGPISLRILDSFATPLGCFVGVYRRGRGATFDFAGGAAYIRIFQANGRTIRVRVTPGSTANLRWLVVPRNANVELQVEQDGVMVNHPGQPTESTMGIIIPAGRPSQTICTLTARNSCPEPDDVRQITLNSYIDPELSVVGMEVTQAIQHFNLTGDMSENNSVRLAQGKHTMVRVYVDSGRRDGFDEGAGPNIQPNVTGRLTVTDPDSGEVETLSPDNPTRNTRARPVSLINRDILEHSLNFRLPLNLVRGRKELRATVESESPYGDRYSAEYAVEVSFHEMSILRLVRILGTDNNTGNSATEAGWDAGRRGARIRYPLAQGGVPIYRAPGHHTMSTDQNLTNEDGWINLLNELEDIADGFEDIGQVWCVAMPNDISYAVNGISRSEDPRGLVFQENLPATFAHEGGHTQGVGHANCGSPPAPFEPGLPADGRIDETGIDVFGYTAYPEGTAEIMSYCDGQDRWPSVTFWDIMFNRFS
jgi:hypothetical protein